MERTDRPGVVYAEGGAKVVWTDSRVQKSEPLPQWLRELITA
jgi:acyl-CoA thioester hydrolase